MSKKWDYEESCEKAKLAGYDEKPDEYAYNFSYFIKDDRIWIHDLESLCDKMGYQTPEEVIEAGYALDDWLKYKDLSVSQIEELFEEDEMFDLYNILDGNGIDNVYLADGMWLTPEGELVGDYNA